MDEIKILLELIKTQGLAAVLTAYVIWEKLLYPKWKKSKGHFISYKDIDNTQLNHGMRISGLENKLEHHLEKEAKEDIKMAKIESDQEHFKEDVREIKDNQRASFKMISEIKNMMIESRGKQ